MDRASFSAFMSASPDSVTHTMADDCLSWNAQQFYDAMADTNDCDAMEAGMRLDAELKAHTSSGVQDAFNVMFKKAAMQTPEELVQIRLGDTSEWLRVPDAVGHACTLINELYFNLGRTTLTVVAQQEQINQLKTALAHSESRMERAVQAAIEKKYEPLGSPEVCSHCFIQAPPSGFTHSGGILYCSPACEVAAMEHAIGSEALYANGKCVHM